MRYTTTFRRRKDERGAALVEFSLVFGLFVFVLYALIAFGFMLALKNSVTHAAAEGARAAIGVTDDPGTTSDERVVAARTRALESLDWLGGKIQPSDVVVSPIAHCTGAGSPTAQCVKVTITYPYSSRPLVPPAPGLGLVTPDNFKATAVVELTA